MAFSKAYNIFIVITMLFVVILPSQVLARELADATQPHTKKSPTILDVIVDSNHFKILNWRDSKLDGTTEAWHNGFPSTQTLKFEDQPGSHTRPLELSDECKECIFWHKCDICKPKKSDTSKSSNRFKTQKLMDPKLDGTSGTWHTGFRGTRTSSKFSAQPVFYSPKYKGVDAYDGTRVVNGDITFSDANGRN